MPVTESEKLGLSIHGFEHIPIKKRRLVFKPSSPAHNVINPPLEGAERNETSPELYSKVSSVSATSGAYDNDHKLDKNKLVKDDDFSGKSVLSDRCGGSGVPLSVNNEIAKNVVFNGSNVKKEPDSHASTALSKDQESTLYSSTLNAPFSKMKQEPIIQKSPARDARFSWDLNTVMVAWEEPSVNEHEISANSNATSTKETKNNYMKDKDLKAEIREPLSHHEKKNLKAEICEPSSHDYETAQNAVVVKTESIYCSSVDIPVTRTLTLENPTHGTFLKWDNLSGQNSHGFGSTLAVDTTLSIDCSMPPRFDHCVDSHACQEKVGPTTKHDLTLNTATCMENGSHQSGVTSNKVDDEDMTKMELTSKAVAMEDMVNTEKSEQSAAVSSMHDTTCSDVDNGVGYGNSQSDNRAGGGMDKLDESLVGYDSQYEDGELRESTINAWKGYRLTEGQNEYNMNKIEDGLDLSIVDASEINSQNVQENSSAIRKSTEGGSVKADSTPSVFLPEKLHSIDEALSVSEPYEMISCQEQSERQDIVQQRAANQSDEWKMNVSGWDPLPENQRIDSNNFTKTRNFTVRKFSYREEQKDRFDTEDVDMKAEGPRFSRKESRTCIGEPSTRDVFPNRGRFQLQRFSSKDDDGLISRPERESGALRSFGRGRYSPNNRPSGRGSGLWNPSLGRNREGGSSYHRPMLEDSETIDSMMNEGGMDLSDTGRHNTSSYVTRRSFRSRSPMNQEVNDFRARLGLRPVGDTDHERFVSPSRGRGRGRSMRYDTRLDDEGSRERYNRRPVNDDYNEFMTEYPHPFPRSRRCLSPIERRGNNNNNSYQHHQFDSRSPSGPRTCSPISNTGFRRRSRSPGFRSDGRIRLPRSPTYRDHPSEYNLGPRNNNSSPPSSRWMNYKEGPVFNRSPPLGRADGQHRERLSFYDSSRKPKQDEYYRSEPAGRFLDISEGGRGRPRYVGNDNDQPNNYRRGGFVRRYNMDGPVKRFTYD
ncbi:hypothetical protein SSX86_001303 [Deinandra increscens subsp. villosa]|uniref:Uncharacterized protein n=1 Tax=Deinandra increscens subsp. villosa TaxID=3103831 RepID=A0AAP0DR22_9ASTR